MGTMLPRSGLVILATMVIGMVLVGCSSTPSYLLDSDIPAPSGFEGRSLSGVKRANDLVVGAQSIYAGAVIDAESSLAEVEKRFHASGWQVERSSGDQVVATAIFAKEDRRCRVRVTKNELDPEMSRISYVVYVEESSKSAAAGASGG